MDDSDSNVKRFHVLVREGLDFEEIARMIEEEIVQVDCVDRVFFLIINKLYSFKKKTPFQNNHINE